MTHILIPTYPADIHANVVAEAMASRGHGAVLWQGADFPTRMQASVWLSNDADGRWQASGPELDLTSEQRFDVVWNRRPCGPTLPMDMHPGDRRIAERECATFNRGLWRLLAPEAWWINPPDSYERCSKLVQLREAVAVGLTIPRTLCSNAPAAIRDFLTRYRGRTIFKSFLPAQWLKEPGRGVALAATAEVGLDDLPDDDVLQLTPGIFQERIDKAHELRLTYMGNHLVAARLLSQEVASGRLDWRMAFDDLRIEPAVLPAAVDRRCRELLARLGLVFGCIDMIVTPAGDHVFVEVNEMGQFLWLEELNPDLRLLDPFCQFLAQRRADFTWPTAEPPLRWRDFHARAERRQEGQLRLHVDRAQYHSVRDLEPHAAAPAPAM